MYNRLAFDALTDVEAYIAAMAANMPAIRVLVRSGVLEKQVFEFVDSWSSRSGSRKSMIFWKKPSTATTTPTATMTTGTTTTITANDHTWDGYDEEEDRKEIERRKQALVRVVVEGDVRKPPKKNSGSWMRMQKKENASPNGCALREAQLNSFEQIPWEDMAQRGIR